MNLFWLAVVVFFYSSYELFCARTSSAVARSMVRMFLALALALHEKAFHGLMMVGFILFEMMMVLVAMFMMRNEAQE